MLMPLVCPDDIGNLVIVKGNILFCAAGPELCCAQQHLCTVLAHELRVPCNAPVLPGRVRNAGCDMRLEKSIQSRDDSTCLRVNDRRLCGLCPIDGAFPRELSALISIAGSF